MARRVTAALPPSERVRRDCRRVADAARSVRIDLDRLPAYAASLDPEGLELPTLDPESHVVGRGAETAAFMLTLEAVNFGSGDFHHLRGIGAEASGYFLVARSIARRFRERGAMTAEELAEIDRSACAALFGQAGHRPAEPLMQRFAEAWRELGRFVIERFSGDLTGPVVSAAGSSQRLAEILVGMPGFRDEALYDGRTVCFYKRAQLTAADLSLALGGRGLGRFHDLDRLTIFADDLVPHVLRTDGILRYAPGLARRIDEGESLTPGSADEVEIRACAIDAAERITTALHEAGRDVEAMRVDYCLWNRGLGPAYADGLRHRVSTRFY